MLAVVEFALLGARLESQDESADAALPASALAVDCWDWPGAYPQIRDERAAPASATQLAE